MHDEKKKNKRGLNITEGNSSVSVSASNAHTRKFAKVMVLVSVLSGVSVLILDVKRGKAGLGLPGVLHDRPHCQQRCVGRSCSCSYFKLLRAPVMPGRPGVLVCLKRLMPIFARAPSSRSFVARAYHTSCAGHASL